MSNRLGLSPNKSVLGKNPAMPSIMRDDGSRVLQGAMSLAMMQQHLNLKSGQQRTQPTLVRGGDGEEGGVRAAGPGVDQMGEPMTMQNNTELVQNSDPKEENLISGAANARKRRNSRGERDEENPGV